MAQERAETACLVVQRRGMYGAFTDTDAEILFLDQFLTRATPIFDSYGGHIERVSSQDATEVSFVANSAKHNITFGRECVLRAVLAAIELQNVMAAFGKIKPKVRMGIGINSGNMPRHNVSSPDHLDTHG